MPVAIEGFAVPGKRFDLATAFVYMILTVISAPSPNGIWMR